MKKINLSGLLCADKIFYCNSRIILTDKFDRFAKNIDLPRLCARRMLYMIRQLNRIVQPGSLKAAHNRMDMRVMVLGSGLGDYRRSVQYWWGKVEQAVSDIKMYERPIYFVSSNVHSIVNAITGVTAELQDDILDFVQQENPEDLLSEFQALPPGENGHLHNFLYYASRLHLLGARNRADLERLVALREKEAGVTRISDPHCLDVEAQVIEINRIDPKRVDPRLRTLSDAEWDLLRQSNAILLNID